MIILKLFYLVVILIQVENIYLIDTIKLIVTLV